MSRERLNTEEFAAIVAAPLKAQVPISDNFDAKVMAAVAQAARPWWKRRVTMSVSPIGGLALAAGFGALMVLGGVGIGQRGGPSAVASSAAASVASVDTVHLVRFVISAPGAQTVALAGDFNGWSANATPLEDVDGRGQWSVTLPLTAGRHEYSFVVDGQRWVADPFAVEKRDEFGQVSSVLRVGSNPVRGT